MSFFPDRSRCNVCGQEHQDKALYVSTLLSFNLDQRGTSSPVSLGNSTYRELSVCYGGALEPAPDSAGGTEDHRVSLWNLVSDAWLKGVQAKVIFSLAVPFCTESWADDNTGSWETLFW